MVAQEADVTLSRGAADAPGSDAHMKAHLHPSSYPKHCGATDAPEELAITPPPSATLASPAAAPAPHPLLLIHYNTYYAPEELRLGEEERRLVRTHQRASHALVGIAMS